MATQGEQPAPVKNRWTRWYMWFVYSSVGFLIFVIVIALFADTPEPANTTPEERMAHLEATQAAEAIAATRQATEQQAKAAEKQAEQQTKEAEDLHEQQTKEAEDNPGPDLEYCGQLGTALVTLNEGLIETDRILNIGYANNQLVLDMVLVARNMDVAASYINELDAPKDAGELQPDAEDMADKFRTYYALVSTNDVDEWRKAIPLLIELMAEITPVTKEAVEYCEIR